MNQSSDKITYGAVAGAFEAILGEYQPLVDAALEAWDRQQFTELLWAKDPTPWKQPVGTPEITDRLGWLDVVDTMLNRLDELAEPVPIQERRDQDMCWVVVLGMGGSSLSPEVSIRTFGWQWGYPGLLVLDSTDPGAVMDIVGDTLGCNNALFVVSSKSGGTIETMSAFKFFYDQWFGDDVEPGTHFIAITDPGTSLQKLAKEKGFRKTFTNMPDIGGRYSALSYFGLVPAALIGVDVKAMLESARKMMEACGDQHPAPCNPGVALGAIMAECAMRGRDKMTLLFSPEISSFGYWVEQLVAESTGKNGQGVLPVEGEEIGVPEDYSSDRLFVYTKLKNTGHDLGDALEEDGPCSIERYKRAKSAGDENIDAKVDALEAAGHPVVRIEIEDKLDLGQEYFRWEFATAVASAFLGVNAFDQPDVASSKKITGEIIDKYKQTKKLPAQTKLAEDGTLTVYADDATAEVLNRIRENGPYAETTVESVLDAHLRQFEPGDYIALMSFTRRYDEDDLLQAIRVQLRDKFQAATTVGYGPRFLHSTGQFHKGGPNTGLFIQFTLDEVGNSDIPGEEYSFYTLEQAQALGDYVSLRDKGRRVIRVHMPGDERQGLEEVLKIVTRICGK